MEIRSNQSMVSPLTCFEWISPTDKSHLETPLEENVNRIIPEEGTEEARTIEDAIAVLRYQLFACTLDLNTTPNMNWVEWTHLTYPVSLSPSTGPEDLDRHPERRMKAAFLAYEEANMPRLKKENPNMRLSQLKQQLKKEWMKSPENPLNQRFANYNSKWTHSSPR